MEKQFLLTVLLSLLENRRAYSLNLPCMRTWSYVCSTMTYHFVPSEVRNIVRTPPLVRREVGWAYNFLSSLLKIKGQISLGIWGKKLTSRVPKPEWVISKCHINVVLSRGINKGVAEKLTGLKLSWSP